MRRSACNRFQGVRQDGHQGLDALTDCPRAAGQIHDQAASPEARDATGERGQRVVPCALGPDPFHEPGRLTLYDAPRGFRCDVPGSEASATGSEDERVVFRTCREAARDLFKIVSHHYRTLHLETEVQQESTGLGSGTIRALAAKGRIADRHNQGQCHLGNLPQDTATLTRLVGGS
jgi:hypothetical protein